MIIVSLPAIDSVCADGAPNLHFAKRKTGCDVSMKLQASVLPLQTTEAENVFAEFPRVGHEVSVLDVHHPGGLELRPMVHYTLAQHIGVSQ